MPTEPKREMNWKHRYLTSMKLARAKQLGIAYPGTTEPEWAQSAASYRDDRLNVLFICSRNQWRSPTAEKIWRNHPALSVRSAGTSPNARRHVSEQDIRWAEAIFVMEDKHKSRLLAQLGHVLDDKPIHVLGIPDEYQYMDPELVEELERGVREILGLP